MPDLLKYGLIPEFVGRLPVIVTLDALSEEALVDILVKPKNALVKQYQRLFEMEDTELTFNEEALSVIARKAIERKIEDGKWVEGKEYRRSPDGGVFVSIEGFKQWLEKKRPG